MAQIVGAFLTFYVRTVVNYSHFHVAFTSQTLPYFVINKLHNLKGLPGMFTACLYAGALRYCTCIVMYDKRFLRTEEEENGV